MIDGPWEAVRAVRRQAYIGAQVIKISATGGVYGRSTGEGVEDEELRAEEISMIVDEAHRRHLKVTAHAIGRRGIANCVDAGIDCIEHGHFIDMDLAEQMKQKGTALVPTLFVYRWLAAQDGIPVYARDKARAIVDQHTIALAAAEKAGLTIGAGSDAGSPQTPHPSLIEEIAALNMAGLSTAAA
ncbi:MAG: amidohydrolase family protein, partial [Desulfobacteraceae bacterium]|nr:amidohydrolase family protein [Desulfobacteraceae bacterium]